MPKACKKVFSDIFKSCTRLVGRFTDIVNRVLFLGNFLQRSTL